MHGGSAGWVGPGFGGYEQAWIKPGLCGPEVPVVELVETSVAVHKSPLTCGYHRAECQWHGVYYETWKPPPPP